jgi:hypothetical protein
MLRNESFRTIINNLDDKEFGEAGANTVSIDYWS